MTTNYLSLYEGLKIFRDATLPFIVEKLQMVYGDDWWEQGVARCFRPEDIERLRIQFEKRHDSLVVERPGDELAEMLDISHFGNIIDANWKQVFGDALGDRKVIDWLYEVREVRNAVAHPQTGDMPADDVWRALHNAGRILRLVNAEAAADLQRLKDELGAPRLAADLLPWWQVAEPHRDIREGRFDAAVLAADLGMVLQDKGAVDYRDAVTFFQKTYPTRGLTELLVDVMRRLAGETCAGRKCTSVRQLWEVTLSSATASSSHGVNHPTQGERRPFHSLATHKVALPGTECAAQCPGVDGRG
jgi:hypothetical protein